MSHWCLTDVDYAALDFLHHPTLSFKDELNNNDEAGGTLEANACAAGAGQGVGRGADQGADPPHQGPHDAAGRDGLYDGAACQLALRRALLDPRAHHIVPRLVGDWQLDRLRLQDVVLPAECDRSFETPAALWTLLLRGLALMSAHCRLTCLDLTGFVPSVGMLYTVLQLVPLLALSPERRDPIPIYDQVIHYLDSQAGVHPQNIGIRENIRRFLTTVLTHRLFARERCIHLPKGHLDIIVDFLPVSARTLTLVCYVVAQGIRGWTGVNVLLNSLAFTYRSCGEEMLFIDPLAPLQLICELSHLKGICGISVERVPPERTTELLNELVCVSSASSSQLNTECLTKLMLAYSHLHLDIRDHLNSCSLILSQFCHVTRLDLSGSSLSGNLGVLLRCLRSRLQYLSLADCCCALDDIDAASSSQHASNLLELDMSRVYALDCAACREGGRAESSGRLAVPPVAARASSPSCDSSSPSDVSGHQQVTTESVTLWTMWNYLSMDEADSASDARQSLLHEPDRLLVEHLITRLPLFRSLRVLELSSHCFQFRVTSRLFSALATSLGKLPSLRRLVMEGFPCWKEDIVGLVEAVAQSQQSLQSLALTMSRDAPRMKSVDKIAFWGRVYGTLGGRRLRTSIEGFNASDEFESVACSSSDSGTLERSMMSVSE